MKKKQVTIEEGIAMQGTEFTYIMGPYRVKTYIKMFDPERGFAAMALDKTAECGMLLPLDENDETCIGAYNFQTNPDRLELTLKHLTTIRDTGELNPSAEVDPFGGTPSCSF